MTVPPHLLWQPERSDADLLTSAVALVDFAVGDSRVHPLQRKRLLDEAIWFVSERGRVANKFRIRHRSAEAVAVQSELPASQWSKHLRHDHVVPRKVLIAELQRPGADSAAVMARISACVVTKDEHDHLAPHAELDGWARYAEAGIQVVDMLDGRPLTLPRSQGVSRAG